MVAGGVSRYSKTDMHIVEHGKAVDGDYCHTKILPTFIETLKSNRAFPYLDRAILMQDDARAHTAHATITMLYDQNVKVWADWPGNSPGLNAEIVWNILQDSVFMEPRPRNRDCNNRVSNKIVAES